MQNDLTNDGLILLRIAAKTEELLAEKEVVVCI